MKFDRCGGVGAPCGRPLRCVHSWASTVAAAAPRLNGGDMKSAHPSESDAGEKSDRSTLNTRRWPVCSLALVRIERSFRKPCTLGWAL